jgi:thiosulfate dehydrogenase (quinone) large subunit
MENDPTSYEEKTAANYPAPNPSAPHTDASKENLVQKAKRKVQEFVYDIPSELSRGNAYLLPLRLFIGLGWIRAGMEKIPEAEWRSGTELTEFFTHQLASGEVVFALYGQIIEYIFIPIATPLAWVIMIGQFLVGIAILTGTFSSAALLAGLFMNMNFIFAGRVNPSAFYTTIQTALFLANTGSILGCDRYLSKKIPFTFLVAQLNFEKRHLWVERITFLGIAFTSAMLIGYALPHIKDFSPNSVDDPAMVLFILSALGGLSTLIAFMRIEQAGVVGGKPTEVSMMLSTLVVVAVVGGAVMFGSIALFSQFIAAQSGMEMEEEMPSEHSPPVPEAEAATHPPEPEEEIEIIKLPSTSLLSIPTGQAREVTVQPLEKGAYQQALRTGPVSTPAIEEVVLHHANSDAVSLSELGPLLAPTLFTSELLANFENTFALTVYSNATGNWPTYVLKAKEGQQGSAQSSFAKVESISSEEIRNLFLEDPGDLGEWRNGIALGVRGRYTTLTEEEEATFNYGWKGNALVIGTSYPSYLETIRYLK